MCLRADVRHGVEVARRHRLFRRRNPGLHALADLRRLSGRAQTGQQQILPLWQGVQHGFARRRRIEAGKLLRGRLPRFIDCPTVRFGSMQRGDAAGDGRAHPRR